MGPIAPPTTLLPSPRGRPRRWDGTEVGERQIADLQRAVRRSVRLSAPCLIAQSYSCATVRFDALTAGRSGTLPSRPALAPSRSVPRRARGQQPAQRQLCSAGRWASVVMVDTDTATASKNTTPWVLTVRDSVVTPWRGAIPARVHESVTCVTTRLDVEELGGGATSAHTRTPSTSTPPTPATRTVRC